MDSTQPNPIHVVGLNSCDELAWVRLFLTHHDELGKNPLTRLLHTSIFVHSISHLKCKKNKKIKKK